MEPQVDDDTKEPILDEDNKPVTKKVYTELGSEYETP